MNESLARVHDLTAKLLDDELTAVEAEELEAVRAMVTEIITVDEFDSEELQAGRRDEPRLGTQHAA